MLLIPLLIKKIENILFNKLIKPLIIIIMGPQYQKMKHIWHMEVMTSY